MCFESRFQLNLRIQFTREADVDFVVASPEEERVARERT